MIALCSNSAVAVDGRHLSSSLPLVAVSVLLLLLVRLPEASTQPTIAPMADWTLALNGQGSEALAELPSSSAVPATIAAVCTADQSSAAVFTFNWTVGEGACADASSQSNTIVLPQQTGQISVIQIPITGLFAFRYYFVRCRVLSGRLSTTMCAKFRLYQRSAAPAATGDGTAAEVSLDTLAIGSPVSLQCDGLVLPSDVVVNVTWTRAGARLPPSADQQMWSSDRSSAYNATYLITSRLVFDNSVSAGGNYACTVDSPKYGRLFSQTTIAYRAAVAAFVELNESPDNSQSSTRVVITCEGYGYPAPTVSLLRGSFMFIGNKTSIALEGGTRSSFIFHQPHADNPAGMSAYACKAENIRGIHTASYIVSQQSGTAAAESAAATATTAKLVSASTIAEGAAECGSPARNTAEAASSAEQQWSSALLLLSLLALTPSFRLVS